MKKLAIIPARGGSKRIPRKNIKDFLGKPIISYSIKSAIQSELFDEVMVSTDDEEIASVAKEFGAKIPFLRSDKNADDFASTTDVVDEVIEQYQRESISFDYICCIYPTAPLVDAKILTRAFEKLVEQSLDSVFPVIQFSYPIQRSLKIEEKSNHISMVWPEFENSRSQDLEKRYHDAGQFYWLNSESYLKERRLFMKQSSSIILDETQAQDIDNLTDWKLAEIKYRILNNVT